MSLNPSAFGLFPGPSTPAHRGVRVLELGAGTGLLAILCRKLLDLRMASPDVPEPKQPGLIVATDFHHDVLANLKVCVDLNFPPHVPATDGASVSAVTATSADHGSGVKIAKLDWTTFPQYMEARQRGGEVNVEDNKEISGWVGESFDLVLASDCVYDPTHAKMLREVAGWVLRLPDENDPNDIGGTYVSLLRPLLRLSLTSAFVIPDPTDLHPGAGEYRRDLPDLVVLPPTARTTSRGCRRSRRLARGDARRRSRPVSRASAGSERGREEKRQGEKGRGSGGRGGWVLVVGSGMGVREVNDRIYRTDMNVVACPHTL
jgi:predicted nicotinamide N-methyase